MNYTVELKDGVAVVHCKPAFTYEDGVEALTGIVEADWREDMLHLLVVDEGSTFSPTRDGIKVLAGLMDRILEKDGARIAIVVTRIVHYGIGRIIEARAGHGGQVRVFLKEEAARQWLGMSGSGEEIPTDEVRSTG